MPRIERGVAPAGRLEIGGQSVAVGACEATAEQSCAEAAALRFGPNPDPRQVPVRLLRVESALDLHSSGQRLQALPRNRRLQIGAERCTIDLLPRREPERGAPVFDVDYAGIEGAPSERQREPGEVGAIGTILGVEAAHRVVALEGRDQDIERVGVDA